LAASGALAPAPSNADLLVQFRGHLWETGGLLPSNPGDVLQLVAAADTIATFFGVDLDMHEVTIWVGDLVSSGQTSVGGFIAVTYASGPIELWLDPAKDHAFGTSPPNATVPGTFRNGTLFLSGHATSMFVLLDTMFGSGAFEATVEFDGGSALATLLAHTGGALVQLGGVLDSSASGGHPPAGYDFEAFGLLDAIPGDPVTPATWGRVKALYRAQLGPDR
jgi:hypothetical protein